MNSNKLRVLAGLPTLKEEASVPSFGLQDEEHAKQACILIAKAGVAVDMEYFMDVFYFNFKSRKDYEKAVKAVKARIDVSKEEHFGG